ncbi:MAG TPA: zinc ribbon domain-containing protein [Methanocella sp.]|jgi:DNA-directed RNA polymerase subunit RPC12/RpoP
MPEFRCNKCGAQVKFEAGDRFVKCSYCGTQLFIDKSGAGFFYIMPFMVDRTNSQGIFRRWAAGARMAKDLDKLANIVEHKQAYFPVYLFRRDVNGKELVRVEPAKSTTLPGLHALKVPAGDLKVFDQAYQTESGAEMINPDIDMNAYLPGLEGKPLEQALVYFPIWSVQYEFKGKKYSAVIDGSSGEVHPGDYPARSSAPYFLIAAASFGVFLIEGLPGLILGADNPGIWVPVVILGLITLPVVTLGAYNTVRRY